jgi:hypothetical protein
MKFTRIFFAGLLSLLVTGCVHLKSLDLNVSTPTSEEGIYILGMKNSESSISLYPGYVKGGVFQHGGIDRHIAWLGKGTNGYIVSKTRANDLLGLLSAAANDSKGVARSANACDNARSITFNVPGGKITYIGDVEIYEVGGRIGIRFSSDFAKAKNTIEKMYPQFQGKLENGSFQFASFPEPCTRIIYR